jgi:phage FluMu gp28-like protein
MWSGSGLCLAEDEGGALFYIGVDLGKTRDPSAIAVVERGAIGHRYVDVRGLERLALGTTYPVVVERLSVLVWELKRCCLVVDGTGLGAPVVDLIRRAQMGCEICEVTITGGERATGSGSKWNVPKQDLMTGVQVLLETGTLRIARKLREAEALARELTDVRATQRKSGRIRMGADGCGQHDDLVMALALACWRSKRESNSFGEGRLPGI